MKKQIDNPTEVNHAKCFCGKPLVGRQTKYCSRICHNRSGNFIHQCYEAQQARGLKRKLELVAQMGGKCEICGYAVNLAALTFHHKDPNQKEFQLDMRSLSNRTLDVILTEVKKCQLLCIRCHIEHHHPQLRLDLLLSESAALTN